MESEEDDAICFSSPDASPERDEATFEEWMGSRRLDTIIDNDDEDDLFADLEDEQDQDEFLDTSGNWLNEIYHDDIEMILHDDHQETSTRFENDDEDENRPPRQWSCHKHLTKKVLSIPTERSPLQELSTKSPSDQDCDDDKPARKRVVNNHRQSVRIMRSLSPPGRRDKGKRPAAY